MPQTCERCKKSKTLKSFKQLGKRDKEATGKSWGTTCLACEQEKQAEELKQALKERKFDKDNQKQTSKVKKELTRVRVRDRRVKLKKRKKDRKELHSAEKELMSRALAKKRLVHFVQRFHTSYQAGWVHHDICRRLERFAKAIAKGESPRLMLFMPPRHGKSELASNYFPSWLLGHYPHFEVIAASYAVSLPIGFSRKIRTRIQDPAYKAVFPKTALDRTSTSAEHWLTTQAGGYVAAGVGGGITGKGAHCLIIDDPVKDAEEADSENQRDKVWDWYGSTAYTRLAPGGGVLVILTRWHDADLAGKLITQMREAEDEGIPEAEIDQWEIIEYAAEATQDEYYNADRTITTMPKFTGAASTLLRRKGEALHPARFPIERLRVIKRTLQPRHWSALYQQNPVPDDGDYFTKDMFRTVTTPPPTHTLKIFIAGDLAIGEKQRNDWTVFAVGGLDYNDQLYVLDIIRFKADTFKIVETLLTLVKKYDPFLVGLEKGQLELAIKPVLKKRMRERRITPTLAEGKKALVPIADKQVRARPLQGRMQQGMVFYDVSQPWFETLQTELMRFPNGLHDDIVDACFPVGTSITLSNGSSRSIEDVSPGDEVLTPFGPRRVLRSGVTQKNAELYELSTSCGKTLAGTAKHPIYTEENGFIALDTVACSGSMVTLLDTEKFACQKWRARFTKALHIADTRNQKVSRRVNIFTQTEVLEGTPLHCIGGYGQKLMATCQKVRTYTTLMVIRLITQLRIWSVSAQKSTTLSIQSSGEKQEAPRRVWRTLHEFAQRPPRGTARKKEEHGTKSTVSRHGQAEKLSSVSAKSAGQSIQQNATGKERSSVLLSASGTTGLNAQGTTRASKNSAHSAGKFLRQGTVSNCIAQTAVNRKSITTVKKLEKRTDVYNLEIEDCPVYFANGILVHNCAWLVRMAMRETPPRKPKHKQLKSWREKLKITNLARKNPMGA